MFSEQQVEALKAPLSRSVVKERTQAGRKLSYIEGWHAIEEANRIFGFDRWDREVVSEKETSRDLLTLKGDRGEYQQWRISYTMRVRVTVRADGETIVREGTGYGSGMAKPEALGDAIESAIKEAETDAMKRALMTFGNPFGLALYDKTQSSVAADAPVDQAPARAGRQDRESTPFDDFPGDAPPRSNVASISDRARAAAPRDAAPQNEGAIRDYIAAFETKLKFCESVADCDTAWTEEKATRARLGIVKGDASYLRLAALGKSRREAIERDVTDKMRA